MEVYMSTTKGTNMTVAEDLLVLVSKNPSLMNLDPEKVGDYYRLLSRYCPMIAKEPLVAGPIIKTIIQFGLIEATHLLRLIELDRAMAEQHSDLHL